jgi:GNAT superfamily N-acetyltransferase
MADMTRPSSLPDGYEFSAETDRIDVGRVHRLLAEHAYWAEGRTLGTQRAIVAASRNYGLYTSSDGEQIAYARVVTDGVTFAWLADVIVDPAHRGRRLGGALIEGILADLDPLGMKRIVLKASEAGRPLYERAGWTPLEGPEDWMERRVR